MKNPLAGTEELSGEPGPLGPGGRPKRPPGPHGPGSPREQTTRPAGGPGGRGGYGVSPGRTRRRQGVTPPGITGVLKLIRDSVLPPPVPVWNTGVRFSRMYCRSGETDAVADRLTPDPLAGAMPVW